MHGTDTAILLSTCEEELQYLLSKMKKRADGRRFGWECLKAALDGGKAREAFENLQRRYQTLTFLFGRVQKLQSIEQRTWEIEERVNTVASGVHPMIQETYTAEARQIYDEMLQWLSPMDYSPQQADFLRQIQEGTGQWFLESRQFQEWYNPCLFYTCLLPNFPQANKSTRLSRKPVTLSAPAYLVLGRLSLCPGNLKQRVNWTSECVCIARCRSLGLQSQDGSAHQRLPQYQVQGGLWSGA